MRQDKQNCGLDSGYAVRRHYARQAVQQTPYFNLSPAGTLSRSFVRKVFAGVNRFFASFSDDSNAVTGVRAAWLKSQFQNVGFTVNEVSVDDGLLILRCCLEDGSFPFVAMAFQVENRDEYWRCELILKLNLEYSNDIMNEVNSHLSWLKFHDGLGFPVLEASFLLVDSSDVNLRSYLVYWTLQVERFIRDYVSDEDDIIAFRHNLRNQINCKKSRQYLQLLSDMGPEGPPRPQRACESCGGNGYIISSGSKRKCTVCKGTGTVNSS